MKLDLHLSTRQAITVVAVERAMELNLDLYKTDGQRLVIIDDVDQDSGDLSMAFHCLRLALGDRAILALAPADDLAGMVEAFALPCDVAARWAEGHRVTVAVVGKMSMGLAVAGVAVAAGISPVEAVSMAEPVTARAASGAEFEIAVSVLAQHLVARHAERARRQPELLS